MAVGIAGGVPDARAVEELEPEKQVSDLLKEPTAEEEQSDAGPSPGTDGDPGLQPAERQWAALPQIGYGPETSFVAGLKLTDRDFLDSGVTIDLAGKYALEGQEAISLNVATPYLFGWDLPLVVSLFYDRNPRRRFFGLGNNDQGPTAASSHEMQSVGGTFTVGWRIVEDLSLNLEAGLTDIAIRDGDRIEGLPPTPVRFPGLPGIDGGLVVPLGVSLVYDERDDVTRPVQGWRVLAKALHVSPELGSDFEYSSLLLDVGYVHPFFDERLILGGHVAGSWVAGPFDRTPFWSLASLGGEDTLRGYFPYRFLGTSRVWGNLEARGKLVEFDFFDIWHVKIDGVAFTDVGRVFIDDEDLAVEGPVTGDLEPTNDLRVSYGGGLRIALSEALIARIDVGFSEEESGLVYLTFGHTF